MLSAYDYVVLNSFMSFTLPVKQQRKMMKTQLLQIFLFVFLVCGPTMFAICHGQVISEVVVIGGGIAGLSAARQIVNKGRGRFTVRVFEARRERYGGRVWTDRLKNPKARGLEVDLGGMALSVVSQFDNPLLNLTRDLELETATIGKAQFIVPWLNKKYSSDELMEAMVKAGSIISEAVNISQHLKEDLSMRDAIDAQLAEKGLGENNVQSLLLRSLPSYIISEYSSLHYKAESLDFGFEQVLLDGMGELLDRLVSGTEDEMPLKINLRTAVRQIKIAPEGKVILRLTDGSQVKVDKVVVAVPAPVIAKGDLLFEPNLPSQYQYAADQIGMADGNKVIVEFDVPFWSDEFGVFIQAAQDNRERGFLQTWINIHKILGKPILMGLLLDEAARIFEILSDEEVQTVVIHKLQSVFGKDAVTSKNIIKILRSSWTKDKWSGGANSYVKVGNSPQLFEVFAKPLCPSVYFAGEHTVFRGHGTLHGAYRSGLRAADQLLNGYCEQKAKEEARRKKEEEKNKAEQKNKDQGPGVINGEEASANSSDEKLKEAEKDEL